MNKKRDHPPPEQKKVQTPPQITSDRPQDKLRKLGASVLSPGELLAILLRRGYGEMTASQLAAQLLAQFNGLPGLVQATVVELTSIRGLGQARAVEIKAALELGYRLLAVTPDERSRVSSPAEAANLLMAEMMFLEQEHLRLILLDTRNYVLDTPTLYIGSLNSTTVRLGEVFRKAIRVNAAALIVVHNHPSQDPSPSPEDIRVTKQMVEAGKLLDMEIMDHIIIGGQRYVSLKERGLATFG